MIRGGSSSAGLSAISYAKAKGLSVIATSRSSDKITQIQQAGADHVVVDKGEIAQELRNIFPDGVSNALEIVGAATVKDTLKCVTDWGTVTVIGLLSGPPILEKFNLMGDLPNTASGKIVVSF